MVVQRSGGADSYKAVTRVIRDWFSLDARLRMVGNPTILTRILSVVHAAASPDFLSGDYVFDHGVRAQPQLVPVPGGNLDTLLWLAWRYVHAFAVEGLRLSERLDAAPDGLAAATLIYDFITPAGAVPGHDLALAGNRRLSDDEISLWPGPLSAVRSPLRNTLRTLRRGTLRAVPETPSGGRVSRGVFEYEPPTTVDAQHMNYHTYCEAAGDVFSSLVTVLRMVGHIAAVGRRLVCPLEPRIGLAYGVPEAFDVKNLSRRWAVCATLLREIIAYPADLLDGHFIDSASHTGLPEAFWALVERTSCAWVSDHAWFANAAVWGTVPGDPDGIQFAGIRCRPTHAGILMSLDLFKQPPVAVTDYPARAGTFTLQQRVAAVVDTRRDPGPAPVPPAEGRDHFRWKEVYPED